MLFLADFLPLVLFLAAYFYKDIYFAVIVLMIAMPVGVFVKYVVSRKVDRIYLWSTIFLLVLGGATVFLRNPAFLYWKPTAFYWALALAFFLSQWIGEKTLVQKFFGLVGELKVDQISPSQWRTLNLVWVVFFLALGLLNASEAGLLRDYDRKVMELINVDDFDGAELAAESHAPTQPSWRHIA